MSNITKLQRHMGQLKNTGSRVAVIMVQMPEKKSHALICELDGLPPKYRDAMLIELQTGAQNHHDLGEYLNTRQFATGEIMLQALFANKHIRDYPIDQIVMAITEKATMPLEDIVKEISGEAVPVNMDEVEGEGKAEDKDGLEGAEVGATPVTASDVVTEEPVEELSEEDMAKTMMARAKEMLAMGKELKANAEKMDPSLKSNRGRPAAKTTEDVKTDGE